MLERKWLVQSEGDNLADTSAVLGALLSNRNIADKEAFLNPPSINTWLKKLPLEFKKSLKKARELILQAIKDNKSIVVYGDYDADGVCATTILFSTIRDELKYENVSFFIPNRFDHGYGLSVGSITEILAQVSASEILFVTVDTGITAVDAVQHIKDLGHSIIITDHHQKPIELPNADCILWEDSVVGSSLAWILARALGSQNAQSLALACTATITDIQPVLGLNRTIVKQGLEILNSNPPLGIKELLEVSGKHRDEITTYDLGFVVGPRLNATGRLESATEAVELLLTNKSNEAKDIALKLHQKNTTRQDKTLEMYEHVGEFDAEKLPKVIISASENYHEGIIGLVAAKLVQKYYRPAIVISIEGTNAKGSVRSVKGVNIIEFLRNLEGAEDLFESLGGHELAAGFGIKAEKLPELEKKLLKKAKKEIADEVLVPTLEIDLELKLSDVTFELLDILDQMKPFGVGNSEPKFVGYGVSVVGLNWVGYDSQHLSLRISDETSGSSTFKAIYFNAKENENTLSLELGTRIDIVYRLKKNEFNGNVFIEFVVVDLKVNKGKGY